MRNAAYLAFTNNPSWMPSSKGPYSWRRLPVERGDAEEEEGEEEGEEGGVVVAASASPAASASMHLRGWRGSKHVLDLMGAPGYTPSWTSYLEVK